MELVRQYLGHSQLYSPVRSFTYTWDKVTFTSSTQQPKGPQELVRKYLDIQHTKKILKFALCA
jgi:hypothetical protein